MGGVVTEPASIPGVLRIERPRSALVPLVFDSPHSGTRLPPDFTPAVPPETVLLASDTHVDALFAHVTGLGAPLLAALFPRSFLDVNRSLLDIDPALLDAPWPHPCRDSPSARRGMGLIWRYAWGDQLMYARALTVAEVEARIDRYWRPYHAALEQLLDAAHARFGRVYHVNCHSMPALGHRLSPDPAGTLRPDFVLGDRHGTSCAPAFIACAETVLRERGYHVVRNQPFPGAELVQAYSDPAAGRHSLQIEINRRLYMDEGSRERTSGFARLEADLALLSRALVRHALDG
jgi:N-formylglutamate deformylase